MTLTEIRQILESRGIQLTKSLGQNFLHDQNQVKRIADSGLVQPGERVLEIGPGLGPLTGELLAKGAHVLAIDMDRRLVEYLKDRYAGVERVEVVHGDALAWLRKGERPEGPYKLVSNLPYSVASPILVELALGPNPPLLMAVTLQWEVAQRLMAAADSDSYGLLSLLVQVRYQYRTHFKIPSSCFFPEPNVESACITMELRPEPLLEPDDLKLFVRIVKRGFSQRRKMMLKLLKQDWPAEKLEAAFTELNISPQERAEKLSLEQFVVLTEKLF